MKEIYIYQIEKGYKNYLAQLTKPGRSSIRATLLLNVSEEAKWRSVFTNVHLLRQFNDFQFHIRFALFIVFVVSVVMTSSEKHRANGFIADRMQFCRFNFSSLKTQQ